MNAIQNEPRSESRSAEPSLAGALAPGVLVLRPGGTLGSADARALELLGHRNQESLAGAWSEMQTLLESGGVFGTDGGSHHAVLDLSGRRLGFDLRADGAEGGVLLIHDAEAAEALEADLRLSALMRSLTQITPAVAHDLRAPINAMVFNVEILKETIAAGKGAEPAGRERQLRYVNVLKEELSRLHREMEIYIAHISPRGDRTEVLDLRELVEELAVLLTGPARKQQVQIHMELPDVALFVEVNRYLFRQALLHLSLTLLSGIPKEGELELLLERREDRAWLRITGDPSDPEPAADFEIHFSPAGTVAPIYAARTLVVSQGGEVRQAAGEPRAYEIELTAVRNKE